MLDDVLFAVNLLAAMVWTGGLVAVAVATTAARSTLAVEDQVRFFRTLGRLYGVAAGGALIAFAITGVALAGAPGGWTGREAAVAALTVLVAALTAVGVRNARAVGRLRSESLMHSPEPSTLAQLRSASRAATLLRVTIAVFTLAAVLVAAL